MDFSVVITTYNRPDYLEQSLKSVLAQHVQPKEIIVVDDNSATSYDDVLSKFDDARIQYLKQPVSGGANVARNRGVKESSGDIALLSGRCRAWHEKICTYASFVFGRTKGPSYHMM